MASIATRHTAAVEALALTGAETILEIGCGQGVATRLILQRLTTGRIIALDRSPKMIDAVAKASPKEIGGGKLRVLAQAIEDTSFAPGSFDRIVAVNVDLNLRLGTVWPPLLKPLLRAGGRLVLAFDAPDPLKQNGFTTSTASLLEANGFAVEAHDRGGVAVLVAHIDS